MTGLLVPARTVDPLAAAINELVGNPERRRDFAAAARRRGPRRSSTSDVRSTSPSRPTTGSGTPGVIDERPRIPTARRLHREPLPIATRRSHRSRSVRHPQMDASAAISSGTRAEDGLPATEGTELTAERLGLDVNAHSSRALTGDVIGWANLVLCMERRQALHVSSHFPGSFDITFPLRDFARRATAAPVQAWRVRRPLGGTPQHRVCSRRPSLERSPTTSPIPQASRCAATGVRRTRSRRSSTRSSRPPTAANGVGTLGRC